MSHRSSLSGIHDSEMLRPGARQDGSACDGIYYAQVSLIENWRLIQYDSFLGRLFSINMHNCQTGKPILIKDTGDCVLPGNTTITVRRTSHGTARNKHRQSCDSQTKIKYSNQPSRSQRWGCKTKKDTKTSPQNKRTDPLLSNKKH